MASKIAKAIGFIGGLVAVVWAMRDRFIQVAVSREPQPPAFRSSPPTGDTGLQTVDGIGPTYASRLESAGITSTEQLARADVGRIAEIADVSTGRAQGWLDQIK